MELGTAETVGPTTDADRVREAGGAGADVELDEALGPADDADADASAVKAAAEGAGSASETWPAEDAAFEDGGGPLSPSAPSPSDDAGVADETWPGRYWPSAVGMSGGAGARAGSGGEGEFGAEGGQATEPVGDFHRTVPWPTDDAVPLFVSVPVGSIEPNEFQPRARFVEEELDALAASVLEVGVLQPILLRRIDFDRYELIAGERRWRAAIRAGLTAVPAIVRPADDLSSLEQAVVENLHRADLNPLEEAAAYRQLVDDFGLTQEAVAKRVGKSRSAVANLLRLFQLPVVVQRLIASQALGEGHARALLAYPDAEFQIALADRAVREGLTVRKVEEFVRRASQRDADGGMDDVPASSGSMKSSSVLAVEELLAEYLDTRVEVSTSGERGRIVVEFADADDLDRLTELVLGVDGDDAIRAVES